MLYVIVLLLSVSISQSWAPYHNQELEKNRLISIDYDLIDSRVQNDDNFRENRQLTHEVIGYLPYWQYETYPFLDYSLLTQINYFSAELNGYGDIINDHNWNNIAFIDYAQERGVKVKLCATLFVSSELTTLLSSNVNRANAINNLLDKVILRGADGIDIDFELVPSSQRENLVIFMEELSQAFHQALDSPIITMATPAVDWSNAWDYNQLAQITDGLFIMGYNYFYAGSQTAGPVSPLGGYFYDLEYSVEDYMNKTNNQLDKLILGLPYYGYDWPVTSALEGANTTGNGEAKTYTQANNMANIYGSSYNETSNAPWISYNDSNWQQCWYDDSLSISMKYEYAKSSNLAGVGIWALGYDSNSAQMWGSIGDQFSFFLQGDLNGDNIVNVVDIVQLVNTILENEYSSSMDLNNDLVINILDVLILVNIILNR